MLCDVMCFNKQMYKNKKKEYTVYSIVLQYVGLYFECMHLCESVHADQVRQKTEGNQMVLSE